MRDLIEDIVDELSEDAMNFLLYHNGMLPPGNNRQSVNQSPDVDPNKNYNQTKQQTQNADGVDFQNDIYPKMKHSMYIIARAAIETCMSWLELSSKSINSDTTLSWDIQDHDVITEDFDKVGNPPPIADVYEVDASSGSITVTLPKRDNIPDRTITFIHAGGGNNVDINNDSGGSVQTLSSQGNSATLYPGSNQWFKI